MRFPHSILLVALAIATPNFLGCSADNGTGGDIDLMPDDGARLEIVGSASRRIAEHAEHEIEVRYIGADGESLSGIIDFGIEGEAGGATLSGHASETDEDGRAKVTLRAGTESRFDVVAVAPDAAPAVITVSVEPMRFGELEYVVRYPGMRPVDSVEAALFTNVTCDALTRSVPSPRETQYTRLDRAERFTDVEVGIPLAVYALGIDRSDNVASEACADVTLDGPTGHVEIVLDDMAELFGGTWAIQEQFDVTAGFSPTVDFFLDMLTGLASDPAGYVVDLVASHPSSPSWLRTALASSTSRAIVTGVLRDAIADVTVPGYVSASVDFGAAVDLAFSNLTLDGELTFEEPDEFGDSLGTHRVTRVYFPLDSGVSERPVSAVATDVPVTVGPTITIAEHELALAFGQVMEMILNDVLLPRLPGSPATTHEWASSMLDCAAIADRISGESSTVRSVTEEVCNVGLALVAGYIETSIIELRQYDTLHLQGTADLIDSDADYDRDVLQDGESVARWTGESGEMTFPGTIEGERLDDETGRTHRVRERMGSLD